MAIYNHTGQVVSDMERSTRFYQNALGFRFWYEGAPPDEAVAKLCGLASPLAVKTRYLALDGFVLELMHYTAAGAAMPYRARTMNEPGLTHLSISVEDIRATAREAVAHGGQIVEESDLGMALMIRDPDGQLIELLDMDFVSGLPPKP